MLKIKDNILASQTLEEEVKAALRKSLDIKKLSNQQKETAEKITEVIIANESPDKWNESINDYISNPTDKNLEQTREIEEIAATHQVTSYLASLLYHSKI